jgi:hypothetical protein
MKLIFLLAILSTVGIHAETLRHRRGFNYENATIKEVQADRVKLSHDSGIGWIDFEDLDPVSMDWIKKQPEYQKFKEESDRAQAAAEQQAIKTAEAQAAQEARKREEADRKKEAEEKLNKERDDSITKEYQKLSADQSLWVSDFRPLERLMRVDEVFVGSYMFVAKPEFLSFDINFISKFGKPDRESTYNLKTTTLDHRLRDVPGVDVRVRELTYESRLLNPTTEKKEDLTIEFYNGFYRRAVASPSGNSSR